MSRELNTVEDVIRALGGPTKAAALVGKTAQAANGWRITKRLPARSFLVLNRELSARGLSAPPSLWGIKEPESAAS